MKLIDKEKVVAEIEKRIKETKSMQPKFDQFWAGQISAFKGILKILDTLEIKDVDLEKELKAIDDAFFDLDGVAVKAATSYLTVEDVKDIAKHFFELGLKASSPTTIADQENEWNELSIKPPFTITMDGNKYSKPMLCYNKFGNYCIAQYVRLQTGYCGWYDGEEEVSITHWKELKAQKGE